MLLKHATHCSMVIRELLSIFHCCCQCVRHSTSHGVGAVLLARRLGSEHVAMLLGPAVAQQAGGANVALLERRPVCSLSRGQGHVTLQGTSVEGSTLWESDGSFLKFRRNLRFDKVRSMGQAIWRRYWLFRCAALVIFVCWCRFDERVRWDWVVNASDEGSRM